MERGCGCDVRSLVGSPRAVVWTGKRVRTHERHPREIEGDEIGLTKRGKGSKCMVVVDSKGIPFGATIYSASPAEASVIETTLDSITKPRRDRGRLRPRIRRLIVDKVYDKDALRFGMEDRDIELICAYRKNLTQLQSPDGRALRWYRRRGKVERTFAWLHDVCRLVARYES